MFEAGRVLHLLPVASLQGIGSGSAGLGVTLNSLVLLRSYSSSLLYDEPNVLLKHSVHSRSHKQGRFPQT